MLGTRGFEIREYAKRTVTPEAASGFGADIVICIAHPETIRTIRANSGSRRPHILALMSKLEAKRIEAIIASGADDFMTLASTAAEFVARAELPKRLAALNETGVDRLRNLKIWQNAPKLLSQEIGALFGVKMKAGKNSGLIPAYAARIMLVSSEEETEIHLMTGVTPKSAESLSQLALGAPATPETVGDVLREVANSAGGAFKRIAGTSGAQLTLGLPRDSSGEDVIVCEKVWSADCDQFGILFGMGIGQQDAKRIKSTELRPGMVLKHDVRNSSGAMLVKAGTALTDRTAQRLIEYCDPDALFDVVEAAVEAA